jgi:chromosomal replication initiation ATPase DnaA
MTHDHPMTLTEIPTEDLRRELDRRLAKRADPIIRRSAQLCVSAAICYGITPAAAYKSRTPLAVKARWAVWMQLALEGYTPTQIGKAFKRDHGAVSHAWKQCAKITQTDDRFAGCLALLASISPPEPHN